MSWTTRNLKGTTNARRVNRNSKSLLWHERTVDDHCFELRNRYYMTRKGLKEKGFEYGDKAVKTYIYLSPFYQKKRRTGIWGSNQDSNIDYGFRGGKSTFRDSRTGFVGF